MTTNESRLGFDLIDVEVHHKSLRNIAKEMAITLMRTSGSPVVTGAKDFSTCILDANGEQLAFSGNVSFHVSTSILGVQTVTQRVPVEDVRPGDAFACNDPHTSGAVHQGDLGIVMPFFYDETLIGWGYVNEHVMDIGGSAISGFAPGARDSYSEALAFPGTRIGRSGQLDSEWEAFLANNVRLSGTVLNDMRSMLAANNAGQRRLQALIGETGIERFTLLNEESKQLAEKGVRSIIASLPDGTYQSRDWVEYDARGAQELHDVSARVVIDGDEMTLHFRGGPQTDSYINGSAPAIIGQAWSTILSMLTYDIAVSQGMWRPIKFDLGPRGSIMNSRPPAPVTMSHIQTGMKVNRMLSDIFSQACSLSDSPQVASRAAGAPAQNQTYFTGFGVHRRTGDEVVSFPMGVGMPAGGPAQTTDDGQESYGATAMAGCDLPDVESEELSQPGVILWRRLAPDTGGAGTSRGGLGVDVCIAITDCDTMAAYAYSNTAYVPPSGTNGGFPGSAGSWRQISKTNVISMFETGVVPSAENLTGTVTPNSEQSADAMFKRGDVYAVVHGGGGGVGDPTLREPSRVARDVADSYVSRRMAETIYGVIVTDTLDLDAAATEERRSDIRQGRIGAVPERRIVTGADPFRPIGISNGRWVCRLCEFDLGKSTDNWRDEAVTQEHEVSKRFAEFNLNVRPHDDGTAVVVRENYCPGCASALAVDVSLAGLETEPQPRLAAIEVLESAT